MSRVGRNNPCPCGSKKKYKYCCIDKESDEIKVLPNIYQLITLKYFDEEHISLETEVQKLRTKVFNSITDFSGSGPKILRDYIKACEEEIKKIASKYSTYEMLFWSRRLGPKNIFKTSELSVMLYREIQSLSIYKYGKSAENIFVDQRASVIPNYLIEYNKLEYIDCLKKIRNEELPQEISKIISDVIRLEILSFIYLKGTQLYRIANKGGKIIFDPVTCNIFSQTSEELSYLLDLYDQRITRVNLFSMTGSYVNPTAININEPYFAPHFQLNVNHKTKNKLFNPQNDAYKKLLSGNDEEYTTETNYLLIPINILNIYNFISLFDKEFEAYYSFTVEDFVLFLGYLGLKVTNDISISIDAQVNILNRAYIIAEFNLKNFAQEFQSLYPSLHKLVFKKEAIKKINVETIFKTFLLKQNNKNDIDLWTRGPKRFIYELSSNYMVIDYSGLTDIISYIVKEITRTDDEIGNKRARYFENALISEINKIYKKEAIWISCSEVLSDSGKKEIDASFIINNVLFLLEAKAVNVSFGFDRGDKQAIEFRTKKMKLALNEAEEKANFIKSGLMSLRPKLPEIVQFICPLVISSYPEYIWSQDQYLFFSENRSLPRILTIEDIKELRNIDFDELLKRNWIVSIK